MPRVDYNTLKDKEIELIYIAAKVNEAKTIEELLNNKSIDYAISIEPYDKVMANIISVEYKGLFFYVIQGQAYYCRKILLEAGLEKGIVKLG